MKNILEKLTEEEIKQLSKAINDTQKSFFGNSLSLRKQESFMAKVFQQKNWSTVLGLATKNIVMAETVHDTKESIIKKIKNIISNSINPSLEADKIYEIANHKEKITYMGSPFSNKFYDKDSEYQKTLITVEVLSNGFYSDPNNLKQIDYDINFGDCSGRIKEIKRESLSRNEMREALKEQGSDPSFLVQINEEIIELIEDIKFGINEKIKYDGDIDTASHEEQSELIMDYYNRYYKNNDIKLEKEDVLEYLKEGFL